MEQFNDPRHSLSNTQIQQVLGSDYDIIWPTIHMKFISSQGGRLFNERLNLEIEKRSAYCESRGLNKRGKRLSKNTLQRKSYDNHTESYDNHMGKRKEERGKRKEEDGNGKTETGKEGESGEKRVGGCPHTWRMSFEIFQKEAETEFDRLYEDLEWIAIQKRDYPGIAVRRTLEKLWREFWGTKDAWEYRRKHSKSESLNWKRTIENGLSDRRHRLYYGKNETDEEQRQIDAARLAKATA